MATSYNGIITNAELHALTPIPEIAQLEPNQCPKFSDIEAYGISVIINGSYGRDQLVRYQDITLANYTPIYYGFTDNFLYMADTEITGLDFGFTVADGADPVPLSPYEGRIGFDETAERIPYGLIAASSGINLTNEWSPDESYSCGLWIQFSPSRPQRPAYIDLVAYISDEDGNFVGGNSYQVLGTMSIEEESDYYYGSLSGTGRMEDLGEVTEPYNQISLVMVFKSSSDDQYWNQGGGSSGDEGITVSINNNSSLQMKVSYIDGSGNSTSNIIDSGYDTDISVSESASGYITFQSTEDWNYGWSLQTNSYQGESNYDPDYNGKVNIPYSNIHTYPDGYSITIYDN